MAPLSDIRILDFSTLLPGPMATLFLAEAGAEVVKIERPITGDDMRHYAPDFEGEGLNFAMLNRGKDSIAVDLKDPEAKARLLPLLAEADILIEQFRPGVMARLGLGYEDIRAINPDIIYCSISGWGASGPKRDIAAHDLNFIAETGILGLTKGEDGAPILPPMLVADIAGGAYPAVVNILLALRQRDKTGDGCWIDVSMGENLFPFLYWALGSANALGHFPRVGGEVVTGGSPRYNIYRTKDDRFIAAAPLEEKFWQNFVAIIDLPAQFRDDSRDAEATRKAVAAAIAGQEASYWVAAFEGKDVCCSLVCSLEEALADPHWSARALFSRQQEVGSKTLPALPSVIAPHLRATSTRATAPKLGSRAI